MKDKKEKKRAPRNRTLFLTDDDRNQLYSNLFIIDEQPDLSGDKYLNSTILGSCADVIPRLPSKFADMIFLDPPYNMDKQFGKTKFRRKSVEEYSLWLSSMLDVILMALKPNGTVYICGDWQTSASIFPVICERLGVRNRITWEREKGRGAFLGSGTTSVVCKKLGRQYVGIEQEVEFALLTEKRLQVCGNEIQGYVNGVFWERNSNPTT